MAQNTKYPYPIFPPTVAIDVSVEKYVWADHPQGGIDYFVYPRSLKNMDDMSHTTPPAEDGYASCYLSCGISGIAWLYNFGLNKTLQDIWDDIAKHHAKGYYVPSILQKESELRLVHFWYKGQVYKQKDFAKWKIAGLISETFAGHPLVMVIKGFQEVHVQDLNGYKRIVFIPPMMESLDASHWWKKWHFLEDKHMVLHWTDPGVESEADPLFDKAQQHQTVLEIIDDLDKRVKCAYCKKRPGKLLQCVKCKSASYCGRECQVAHWNKRGHKIRCMLLVAGALDPKEVDPLRLFVNATPEGRKLAKKALDPGITKIVLLRPNMYYISVGSK